MYTTADWWSMWIGLLCFSIAVLLAYVVPYGRGGSRVKYVIPQPMVWVSNPLDAWDFASCYVNGFFKICITATIAFWIGVQRWCMLSGLGYAIWSLIFGIIIGNTPLTKGNRLQYAKLVAKDGEFFIKCALVCLAVEFKILGQLGGPAIAVSWIGSPIALILSYFIGTRWFKADAGPALLIATGATWCGASAISAVASVIGSPSKDVSLSIGIVAAATVIFTFAQPYFAMAVGMDEHVAGAWIGASVDQTGNVIASAAIISDEAVEIAGVVKIILNSGLGILSSIIALLWQVNQEQEEGKRKKCSLLFLWDKFPKFALGYLICCGVLSLVVQDGTATGDALPRATQSMSKWFFCIAFVGIGISTNLKELFQAGRESGMIGMYFTANTIDIILAYLLAHFLF